MNEESDNKLRDLLKSIVMQLVDRPDQVHVSETISDGGTTSILTVRVGNGETGKVIGKDGRNAKALRALFESIAAKDKRRIMLEIDDGKRRRRRGQSSARATDQKGS